MSSKSVIKSGWVLGKILRRTRRNYVIWANLIGRYPYSITFTSVLLTAICVLSFFLKTPYYILPLPLGKTSLDNQPEAFILQFSFENKLPTHEFISQVTEFISNHKDFTKNCVPGSSLKDGLPPELAGAIPRSSCVIFSPSKIFGSDYPENMYRLFKTHKMIARLLWGGSSRHSHPVVTAVLRHDIDPRGSWITALIDDVLELRGNNTSRTTSTINNLMNVYYHFGYPAAIDWLVYLSAGVLMYAYYYITVRKINFLSSSVITSAAVCGTLIMSLLVALGCCLTLDLNIYVGSGPFERGISWVFIYYSFTFIAFESVLMLTQCIIDTPVEEGPTERIAHGLLRGGTQISKFFFSQLLMCGIGTISEYSRSFSIFALIMVLSNFALLHSFFAPILFLELRQLERSEPTWVKKRSTASDKLRRYWNSRKRRTESEHDELEDVTPLVDIGENHIDPMEGMFEPMRIRLMKTWAAKAIAQKIAMSVFMAWICYQVFVASDNDESGDSVLYQWEQQPWPFAFRLYERELRGKHLTFFPVVKIPFDPGMELSPALGNPESVGFDPVWTILASAVLATVACGLYKMCSGNTPRQGCFISCLDQGPCIREMVTEDVFHHCYSIQHMVQDVVNPHRVAVVDALGTLRVFDIKSNILIAKRQVPEPQVQDFKLSATQALGLSSSGAILTRSSMVVDKSDPNEEEVAVHDGTIWSISLRNRCVTIGFSSGCVQFFDIIDGTLVPTMKYLLDDSGVSFLVDRDHDIVGISVNGTMRRFPISTVISAHPPQVGPPGVILARAMSPLMVTASLDGRLNVWNFDGNIDHVCIGHLFPVTALNLYRNGKSPNDVTAMSADQSGEIRVWTLLSGRCQFVLRQDRGDGLATIRLRTGEAIVNVWPTKDLLIALTASSRLLIWTHRSGHFRQALKIGTTSNGGGHLIGESCILTVVDQWIAIIDLNTKKKAEVLQTFRFSDDSTNIRSTAMCPTQLFHLCADSHERTSVFAYGRFLKKISLPAQY